ncbi:AidA/PixA family protein [Pseudomonas sp. NFIX28]|uniref:AidA/PixA family protein n=1 Tax=Pseudomonas sp. NFIX28 TaxID=1566235 RepID=UPI000899209B|nr:AidA/PixA family protein [Pseudomonas sp. NFIX28]SDZ51470.1 Inclusion body protein [Pseudomonas sp. NFIX28]
MGTIVDVLTVVDVDTIIQHYSEKGRPDISTNRKQPTMLSYELAQKTIHMLAKFSNGLQHQGTGNLYLPVSAGDVIRWRATDISKNLGNAVILDRFKILASNPQGIIDHPRLQPVTDNVSSLNPSNPDGPPIPQMITTNAWEATAGARGTVTYTWSFIIVDRHNKVIGCCEWDPTLNID